MRLKTGGIRSRNHSSCMSSGALRWTSFASQAWLYVSAFHYHHPCCTQHSPMIQLNSPLSPIGRNDCIRPFATSSMSTGSRIINSSLTRKATPIFEQARHLTTFRLQMISTSSSIQDLTNSSPDDKDIAEEEEEEEDWKDVLPFTLSAHNSATITIPDVITEGTKENKNQSEDGAYDYDYDNDNEDDSMYAKETFAKRLENSVEMLRSLNKSSVWVEVPMSRASLIEEMTKTRTVTTTTTTTTTTTSTTNDEDNNGSDKKNTLIHEQPLGFQFHHAYGNVAKLNLWLRPDTESKVPEFATHHVGVGAVIVNSQNEILCVRELRKNYMPWKIPGGLSELGESLADAAKREVLEETGIDTTFHSILSFRHTHGLANGRSDLYFVCRLDPVEELDDDGNPIIPEPYAQACEIEATQWIPMSKYRSMVDGTDMDTNTNTDEGTMTNNKNEKGSQEEEGRKKTTKNPGHPMMSNVMKVYDQGLRIQPKEVSSVVPGRKPNPMYMPVLLDENK